MMLHSKSQVKNAAMCLYFITKYLSCIIVDGRNLKIHKYVGMCNDFNFI